VREREREREKERERGEEGREREKKREGGREKRVQEAVTVTVALVPVSVCWDGTECPVRTGPASVIIVTLQLSSPDGELRL
jgi:hypothetical protein